jgi:hypothetical protein
MLLPPFRTIVVPSFRVRQSRGLFVSKTAERTSSLALTVVDYIVKVFMLVLSQKTENFYFTGPGNMIYYFFLWGRGVFDSYARSKFPVHISHLEPRNISLSSARIQIKRNEKGNRYCTNCLLIQFYNEPFLSHRPLCNTGYDNSAN